MGACVSKKQAPQTWPTAQIIDSTHKCVITQQNGESLEYDTTTDTKRTAQINLYNAEHGLIGRAEYDTKIWHPGVTPPTMKILEDDHTCQLKQDDGNFLQYTISNKPKVVPNLIFLNAHQTELARGRYINFITGSVKGSVFDCSCDEQVSDSRLYDNICSGIDI